MPVYRWNEVQKERMNPLVERQAIHGQTVTMARFEMRKGALVPEHSHHNEQISTVEKGRLKFLLGGKEVIVGTGDLLFIPPHTPHSAEALEDSVGVDVFTPLREDWIRGDDSYLRK